MKCFAVLPLVFICILSFIFSSLVLAEDTTSVPVKDWWDYTEEEKKILRERWTEEKVEAVVRALQTGKDLGRLVPSCPAFAIEVTPNGGRQIDMPPQADLRGIPLKRVFLDDADLRGAWLQGANISEGRLRHSLLEGANLQGANLYSADLEGAHLELCNLQSASLRKSNLQRTDLRSANLQNTILTEADLEDTDLFRAVFDSTSLFQVNLEAARNIRYILWGDHSGNRYVIGEEKQARIANFDINFRRAENTYKDLKALYKKELLEDIAKEFHYRENEIITKKYLRTFWKFWDYLWGLFRIVFLKWTYGYGSKPIWLLRYSVIVIFLFGLIFTVITQFKWKNSGINIVEKKNDGTEELKTLERKRLIRKCLYFSLLSFATFGYGAIKPKQWLQLFLLEPKEYKPVRWARIFVGIEAALGIWIFALLVTVLFGK
jgi:hypothetical protein